MLSLNPSWMSAGFHRRVAELSRAGEGDRVLDLGCGRRAPTVSHLLAKVGERGHVVAADRIDLELVIASHREAFDAGRLSLAGLDIGRDLPFANATFDRVVCQNVIECVQDRNRLAAEIKRILRPGGTALIGHHDFDGAVIASDDRNLTRQLVHGYADQIQAWQDASEGQMGRLLPGLVTGAGFAHAETETVLFVDLELAPDGYARVHLDGIVAVAGACGVTRDRAETWLESLRCRSALGRFYHAIPWVYVLATKNDETART